MTIKAAVIGASFARAAYLPALKAIEDVEVVAVSSARLESARSAADAFGVADAYDDWQAMLNKHAPDFVAIATPTIYHAPMTLAALEAGAHVLCEKPAAMNAGEARQMLERAEALGRVHAIGHELRFNPNRRKIRQLIADGAIGEVRHVNIVNISSTWGDPASRPAGDWWSLAEMGGGRLGANGSHQIDLLRYWLGDVGAISGQIATMAPNRFDKTSGEPWIATADDEVSFLAEMANGALASVFLSGVARHSIGNHTHVFGSEGTIKLADADEKLLFARAGEDYADVSEADPNAALPGIGKGIWNVSVVVMMRELIGAIRAGEPPTIAATFADGLATQIAMDGVRQSSAERRWVTV
ncbi:MAG TPA: Gfo/Idh/MocA family oxidoreductase [Candidatus Limnocylindrales bacterium]|nr:Gfo/Idh/MocA family oxidoreductase [Candidatus Limnocylindrales bacterium]